MTFDELKDHGGYATLNGKGVSCVTSTTSSRPDRWSVGSGVF